MPTASKCAESPCAKNVIHRRRKTTSEGVIYGNVFKFFQINHLIVWPRVTPQLLHAAEKDVQRGRTSDEQAETAERGVVVLVRNSNPDSSIYQAVDTAAGPQFGYKAQAELTPEKT